MCDGEDRRGVSIRDSPRFGRPVLHRLNSAGTEAEEEETTRTGTYRGVQKTHVPFDRWSSA